MPCDMYSTVNEEDWIELIMLAAIVYIVIVVNHAADFPEQAGVTLSDVAFYHGRNEADLLRTA